MDDKLKELIFNRLYKKLRNVEIIPYNNSIWFIDREKEYWYLEFEKSGMLWWRYNFFNNFFEMFSLDPSKFEPILSAWVEEVLNHKVSTTDWNGSNCFCAVEEVLNHKVSTTFRLDMDWVHAVEEVLNHKVSATNWAPNRCESSVKETLNNTITMTSPQFRTPSSIEKVLKSK